jgi:hypothetical protein
VENSDSVVAIVVGGEAEVAVGCTHTEGLKGDDDAVGPTPTLVVGCLWYLPVLLLLLSFWIVAADCRALLPLPSPPLVDDEVFE